MYYGSGGNSNNASQRDPLNSSVHSNSSGEGYPATPAALPVVARILLSLCQPPKKDVQETPQEKSAFREFEERFRKKKSPGGCQGVRE